ncbi:MAG: PilN domain-containing protein [Methylococcaceae bacterium]
MAKINLLPWREELRKQKKQDFIIAIGLSAFMAVVILGAVHVYIDQLQSYQEKRNKVLQDEIALVDKKIVEIKTIEEKKSKLLAKIDLIYKLQKSRPEIVHLFDEIPKATPDGLFLTKVTQKGDELIFEGKSQSNARVSAFMRAIEASQWLQKPTLNLIKLPEKDKTNPSPDQSSDFILRAKQGKEVPEAGKEDKR